MDLNRRQIIKGIGAALCAGVVPKFVAELIAPVVQHVPATANVFIDRLSHEIHVAVHKAYFDLMMTGTSYVKTDWGKPLVEHIEASRVYKYAGYDVQ